MVRALVIPALLLLAVFVVDIVFRAQLDGEIRLVITLGGIALFGLWVMFAWAEWKADHLFITNKRVIMQRGIGRRTVKMFMLDNVMYVFVHENGLGRMLHYATVEIVAPGPDGVERFERAPDPHELSNEILYLSRNQPSEGFPSTS